MRSKFSKLRRVTKTACNARACLISVDHFILPYIRRTKSPNKYHIQIKLIETKISDENSCSATSFTKLTSTNLVCCKLVQLLSSREKLFYLLMELNKLFILLSTAACCMWSPFRHRILFSATCIYDQSSAT